MTIDYQGFSSAAARTLATAISSATGSNYPTYFSNPDNAGSAGKIEWYGWNVLATGYGLTKPLKCYVQAGLSQSVQMSQLGDTLTISLATTDYSNIGLAITSGSVTVDTEDLASKLYTLFDARLTSRGTVARRPQAISSPKVKVFSALTGQVTQLDPEGSLFPVKLDPIIHLQPDANNYYAGPTPNLYPGHVDDAWNTSALGFASSTNWGYWIRNRGILGIGMGVKFGHLTLNSLLAIYANLYTSNNFSSVYDDLSISELASFNGMLYIDLPNTHGAFLDGTVVNDTVATDAETYIAADLAGSDASYNALESWNYYATTVTRKTIELWHNYVPNAFGIAVATPVYLPNHDYDDYAVSAAQEAADVISSSLNYGLIRRTPQSGDTFTELDNLAVVLNIINRSGISPEGSDIGNSAAITALKANIGPVIDAIRNNAPETPILLKLDITDGAGGPVSATFLDLFFREVLPGHVIHGIILAGAITDYTDFTDIMGVLAPHLAQLQRYGTQV